MLFLFEASLDSLHNALSLLQVELHVDLAVRLVLEVVQDLVSLLLRMLVVDLCSAVPASFQGLQKLLVLAINLGTHLSVEASLELL